MIGLLFKHKTYTFIGLGILVALIAWWTLSAGTPASTSLLETQTVGDQSVAADKGLVGTLLQLRAVSLSGAIFSDPAFRVLRDFGTQIIPEPVGRPNPFAPISAPVATTSARDAQLFKPTGGR